MENQVSTAAALATMSVPAAPSVNFFDPQQFEIAQRMSKMFACSKLVPTTYQISEIYTEKLKQQDKLPQDQQLAPKQVYEEAKLEAMSNCIIALDIAQRIGAAPLMVMQNLVIIYGRPSWSSKFLISTVNTCGRFEPLKFRFTEKGKLGKFNYTEYQKTWVPGSNGGRGYYKNEAVTREFDGTQVVDLECVAYTTAKGSKDVLESSPISLRMAIDEGWYLKNGSKWRTMPRQMLMYRAASFWTSVYAPELSMGMRTVEETQDIHFAEAEEIHPDAAVELEQEKAANANKESISFSDDADSKDEVSSDEAGSVPPNVDPETGEIKGEQPNIFKESQPTADGPGY